MWLLNWITRPMGKAPVKHDMLSSWQFDRSEDVPVRSRAPRWRNRPASKHSEHRLEQPQRVAGNGLIDRRALLGRGIVFAGATATGARQLAHRRRRRATAGRSVEHEARRRRSRPMACRRSTKARSCAR